MQFLGVKGMGRRPGRQRVSWFLVDLSPTTCDPETHHASELESLSAHFFSTCAGDFRANSV
jgi:hypothetical protein